MTTRSRLKHFGDKANERNDGQCDQRPMDRRTRARPALAVIGERTLRTGARFGRSARWQLLRLIVHGHFNTSKSRPDAPAPHYLIREQAEGRCIDMCQKGGLSRVVRGIRVAEMGFLILTKSAMLNFEWVYTLKIYL